MHAKFDHSSFSRSRDIGAHQHLNGSRDLTTPISGIVCHPLASTSNLYNKFEVFILTHYEDTKGDTKYRKWGCLG